MQRYAVLRSIMIIFQCFAVVCTVKRSAVLFIIVQFFLLLSFVQYGAVFRNIEQFLTVLWGVMRYFTDCRLALCIWRLAGLAMFGEEYAGQYR